MRSQRFLVLWLLSCLASQASAAGSDFSLTIPDEIESTSGLSTGLSNGGAAAFSGVSSVRSNPAMLALDKTYAVSGSYHWPAIGSDFYQVGVVDSKTSEIAAGVSLVRPSEPYEEMLTHPENGKLLLPLKMRLAFGIGYSMNKVAVGISGQIIEAYKMEADQADEQPKKIRGNTVGIGMAGLFTPSLRFSLSSENLANRQVAFVAPRFIRAGLAFLAESGTFTAHADYINRAALIANESSTSGATERRSLGLMEADWAQSDAAQAEQQLIGSFTAKAYDLLRIVGSYGAALETERQMYAGGVALVNQNWTLSYMAMRPDTRLASAHQAVSLELSISL